jgi:hypothetical protein
VSGEEMVTVTFHLAIGLVGCRQEREEQIPRSDIPDDPIQREAFLSGYCDDVFNGEVETWWEIAGEDA